MGKPSVIINRKEKLICTACLLFLYSIAYLKLLDNTRDLDYLIPYLFQFQLLFLILIGLVGINLFVSSKFISLILLLFKYIIILMMGIPQSHDLQFETVLTASLLLETTFIVSTILSLFIGTALIAITISFQRQYNFFELKTASPEPLDIIVYILISGSLLIGFILFQQLRYKFYQKRNAYRQLEAINIDLVKTNIKLQDYAIFGREEAMLLERRRISQEIHDSLGYTLVNLNMMIQASLGIIKNGQSQLREILNSARDHVKGGIIDLRKAVQSMREAAEPKQSSVHLFFDLVKTVSHITQKDISIHFGNMPWYLDEEIEKTIFRLIQEGITNALQHGEAEKIVIIFSKENNGLNVSLSDDGIGVSDLQQGYGITGMKERIQKLNGYLLVNSSPESGTSLIAWIPLYSHGKKKDYEENKSVLSG